MDISIIVVNYRVKFFLEQTLRSVEEALQGLSGEVIVIDNNSGDDSFAFSREKFPQFSFIENSENVGFARANNQGIALAKGDFTLILNPDTIISPTALREPIKWMREHPECASVGLHMIDGNGVFLPESKRAFPTPWVSFCKIFGLSSLFPNSRWFAKYHLRFLDEHQPHEVDILSGAFMLCRTSLLQQIGGLDEDFFMYGEDIDLSYRLVKQGFKNYYLPVNMIHYKGESTKKDSMRYVRVFYDAMLIFYHKHFPRLSWILYPIIKLGVIVRASLSVAHRLVKRLFKRLRHESHTTHPWVILSDNTMAVSMVTGINHYKRAIPADGDYNVLIDDSSYTYEQIIDTIADKQRKGLSFHIFSSRNGIVISPKMSQT